MIQLGFKIILAKSNARLNRSIPDDSILRKGHFYCLVLNSLKTYTQNLMFVQLKQFLANRGESV